MSVLCQEQILTPAYRGTWSGCAAPALTACDCAFAISASSSARLFFTSAYSGDCSLSRKRKASHARLIAVVRRLQGRDDSSGASAGALAILDERYARGEIDREEYLRRRKDIGGD